MKIYSKKGEGGQWDYLIKLIVALIALMLLFGLIFRADVVNYIRNLPDYGDPDEDREIIYSDDKIINNVNLCGEENVVGEIIPIKKDDGFVAGAYELMSVEYGKLPIYLKFIIPSLGVAHIVNPDMKLNRAANIKIKGADSGLFIHYSSGVTYIALDELSSENIGKISKSNIVEIDDAWINDDSLRSKHPTISSKEDLAAIDNGFIGGLSGLKICKVSNE